MRSARNFSCSPESVSQARAFVREVLQGQPRELVEAAELLTSELTSNCVRHARTDFELVIDSNGEVRVEVRDAGAGKPARLAPSPQDPSGRGLGIVDALSESWGIAPEREGKTVWFTLSHAPRAAHRERSSRRAAGRCGPE